MSPTCHFSRNPTGRGTFSSSRVFSHWRWESGQGPSTNLSFYSSKHCSCSQ
jgi:hypothetical protein